MAFFIRSGLFLLALFATVSSQELTTCELEAMLRPLLTPSEFRTIQTESLRRELLKLIKEGLDEEEAELNNLDDDKRSINSLARWNNMPNKRNLEALARAGLLKNPPENDNDNDSSYKRSSSAGQYPTFQPKEIKRGIESLARNGELHHHKRELQELLDDLYDKRNIGSLARNYNFPVYGKRYLGSLARSGDLNRFYADKRNIASIMRNSKRSLASLVRENNLPEDLPQDGAKTTGKRNVAALLRQDSYQNSQNQNAPTEKPESDDDRDMDKRSFFTVKGKHPAKFELRNKREVDYYDDINEEYPLPVYQNQNLDDYNELLLKILSGNYPISNVKRFLGRLPQMGKPKTTPPPNTRRYY